MLDPLLGCAFFFFFFFPPPPVLPTSILPPAPHDSVLFSLTFLEKRALRPLEAVSPSYAHSSLKLHSSLSFPVLITLSSSFIAHLFT